MYKLKSISLFFLIISLSSCSIFQTNKEKTLLELATQFEENFQLKNISFSDYPYTKIDTILIDSLNQTLTIKLNKQFSVNPFRQETVDSIYSETEKYFSPHFLKKNISLQTTGYDIRDLIPNFFRGKDNIDIERLPQNVNQSPPIIFNSSKNLKPTNGLFNKNIALWHSHGWYYNHKVDRWLWQRARLFQTVEDLGPMTFTIPYVIPMLENAGANVFIPRERDYQLNEIIVDNEDKANCIFNKTSNWEVDSTIGFRHFGNSMPANFNPFSSGTNIFYKVSPNESSNATYIPQIPEDGKYSVYISYNSFEQSSDSVLYTIYHSGGKTDFIVNQQIGNNTWIHLGKFNFHKGKNIDNGAIVISSKLSKVGEIISTDAVRLGGGFGVVARNGRTSGKPKFIEGARYFLQFLGMPDTLVYNINGNENDYKDDYQSRGEWVNYLKGTPSGPNRNRTVEGLGIPIDVSLAFHTDAGISKTDTTIGTLSIYSSFDFDSLRVFPEGYSRLANRDLSDILQTEIVDNIRAKYDPVWRRRQLRDALYSEAARPNIPSTLLELASHQNFLDARFMADPRFKFDVSRSIYKSILKFLSIQNNFEYVVQPLPVKHFAIEQTNKNSIKLSWNPEFDSIEKSAEPNGYIVYISTNDNGFDNGTFVESNFFEMKNLDFNKIYNFKVTAINKGGESFPSEVLSCGFKDNNNSTVLIVNGFDRIAPPAIINLQNFSGFINKIDQGVPYQYDLGYTGEQHNFSTNSKWVSDDIPGHGTSYANYETKVIAGNTFNYPYIHGKAILENDYSFISISDEAFSRNNFRVQDFKTVDLIMGEEKTTFWTKSYTDSLLGVQFSVLNDSLVSKLKQFLDNKGNLFISGSYIASDIFLNKLNREKYSDFTSNYLHFNLDADHAVVNGNVFCNTENFINRDYSFSFITELNDSLYNAEAPDAIKPAKGARTILRYSENSFSAAIAYKNSHSIIAFGFPFETIRTNQERKTVMSEILDYFK